MSSQVRLEKHKNNSYFEVRFLLIILGIFKLKI